MQRQENKIRTESGGFSMDDSEYLALRTNISHIVDEGLNKFLERHSDDDKHLYELVQHIEHTKANDYTWDMEKIKIVL